jgi:hypothetical protein
MSLEEAGITFSADQWARLGAYRVAPHTCRALWGQWQTQATVFARRGPYALAVDDSEAQLAFGKLEDGGIFRGIRRISTVELAVRTLLSADRHGI